MPPNGKRRSLASADAVAGEEMELRARHWDLMKDVPGLRATVAENGSHVAECQQRVEKIEEELALAAEDLKASVFRLDQNKQELVQNLAEQKSIGEQSGQVSIHVIILRHAQQQTVKLTPCQVLNSIPQLAGSDAWCDKLTAHIVQETCFVAQELTQRAQRVAA